jgi:hypothetical protein
MSSGVLDFQYFGLPLNRYLFLKEFDLVCHRCAVLSGYLAVPWPEGNTVVLAADELLQ